MPEKLIVESNRQYLGAFSRFALGCSRGAVERRNGVLAMFGRVPLFIFNACGFTDRVTGPDDLRERGATVRALGDTLGLPYFLSVCQGMVDPEVRPHGSEILGECGLQPIMQWMGMVSDQLLPPTREPEGLTLRPVVDEATRIAVNDLNSLAYDMPVELGRETFALPSLWEGLYSMVGYADKQPVATATVVPVEGCLYVAMVATLAEYRRRGYAEACMRAALDRAGRDTGLTRTVLHATDMGRPVYLKMGYQEVTPFLLYAMVH